MASVSDDDVAMKPPAASESTTHPSTTVPDNETENNKKKDTAAAAAASSVSASDPNTNAMTVISLGGKRSQKSFALLDGVFQDPESDEKERVTIDITRLPALLGRSNESDKDNPNFFGLGKKKALSRKHCTIYYRDKEGGHAEWDTTEQTTIYKDAETVGAKKSPPKPNPHLVKDDDDDDDDDDKKEGDGLPPNGFFVIECLGKNRILVDRTRVEQGESMVLRSGSAIRISSYMFYFLLPTDAEPKPHLIELPLSDEEKEKAAAAASKNNSGKKKPPSATKAAAKKRSSSCSSISSSSSSSKNTSGKDKTNTAGIKKAAGSASKKRPVPTIAPSAMKKPKKASTLAELEVLPVEELIEKMDEAVSKGLWDRKNQFIGTTVCYHAVRSAGAAIPIQEKVVTGGGVSRSDIMEWIEQSDMYGGWVQQMLTNMEPRSYQAAITKSLLKSGFTRTSGAGRYIKWLIPADIPMKVKAGKKKKTKPKGDEGKTTKPKQKPKPPIESLTTKEKDDEGDDETGDDNDSDDGDDDDGSNSDQQPGETPNKEEEDADEEEEEEEEDSSRNDAGRDDDNNEAGENNNESDVNEEEDGNEEEIEDDDDANNNNGNDTAEEQHEQSDDNTGESEGEGDMDITI